MGPMWGPRGSVWGLRGVRVGSVRGSCGAHVGSVCLIMKMERGEREIERVRERARERASEKENRGRWSLVCAVVWGSVL